MTDEASTLPGWERSRFSAAGLTRDVLRRGAGPGGLDAVNGGVGRLLLDLVLARRFAQLFRARDHVEDVVDDLEEQAELVGERAKRRRDRRLGACVDDRAAHGRADQAPGLEQVDLAQRVGRAASVVAQVQELPADHSVDT